MHAQCNIPFRNLPTIKQNHRYEQEQRLEDLLQGVHEEQPECAMERATFN